MRDGAGVARESHKLQVVGSNPAPASECLCSTNHLTSFEILYTIYTC